MKLLSVDLKPVTFQVLFTKKKKLKY